MRLGMTNFLIMTPTPQLAAFHARTLASPILLLLQDNQTLHLRRNRGDQAVFDSLQRKLSNHRKQRRSMGEKHALSVAEKRGRQLRILPSELLSANTAR